MVHIGAMAGAALSQGHSTSLGFSTGLFRRFQNPKDKRDFVTAGTAVGIAVCIPASSPHTALYIQQQWPLQEPTCTGDSLPINAFAGALRVGFVLVECYLFYAFFYSFSDIS